MLLLAIVAFSLVVLPAPTSADESVCNTYQNSEVVYHQDWGVYTCASEGSWCIECIHTTNGTGCWRDEDSWGTPCAVPLNPTP